MNALIFDMDGTMVDNMMTHHRGWQKTLKRYGLDLSLEEVVATCHWKNGSAFPLKKKAVTARFSCRS
jgi:beta-phosphoglucomutase-like phosphatase (HAD superfamily)